MLWGSSVPKEPLEQRELFGPALPSWNGSIRYGDIFCKGRRRAAAGQEQDLPGPVMPTYKSRRSSSRSTDPSARSRVGSLMEPGQEYYREFQTLCPMEVISSTAPEA